MLDEKEFIIFADESEGKGAYYSNFYGGILVGATQYLRITHSINRLKKDLNLAGEIKWSKVTENYLSKYEAIVDALFDEIEAGNLKLRVKFSQNAHIAVGLSQDDHDLKFFKLYYQFIKHAFGLHYPVWDHDVRVRLYFDRLPDTKEKAAQFKAFIASLNKSSQFKDTRVRFHEEDITEVDSKEHVLLQCADVILGAMAFRLNDKHKIKATHTNRRGRRTVAKEKLYRKIYQRICIIHPNFNIGIKYRKRPLPISSLGGPLPALVLQTKKICVGVESDKREEKKLTPLALYLGEATWHMKRQASSEAGSTWEYRHLVDKFQD